ncbi:MAG: Flp pilus assembly protein CpaB [Lutisporaceae bacterium]|jgi:pilus assembly protein CpaB
MSLFKNRTVVGVICILLSLLICFGVTPLFNKSVSQKTEIVRVTKEIKAGDEITKDMIQTVEVGGFGLPENVIRQSETVIGKYAKADLSVGDYILNTKLSDTPAAENAYLYNLDGTKQAMSVTIKSFANGLSGKLQSGDIVSVIAPDYKKQGATVIPAELKYVEVISVTASSGYDANTGEVPAGDDERELPSTVTLLVSPEQSKILAELESDGKLHLSLVYRGSHANTTKFLEAQDKVIAALYPAEQTKDSPSDSHAEGTEENPVSEAPAESEVQ